MQHSKIPLRGGRLFTTQDGAGHPACAIVNEAFVRRFLQGRDPYSSNLRLGWGGSKAKRIVGVVSDIRPTATSPVSNPEVYVPFPQFPLNDMSILIRSAGDPHALVAPLRATIHHLDETVPLDRLRSMEDYLLLSSATQQFLMWLLVAFATMATLLSAVGIYGVLSDATAARTQEFGIRLALGSSRWRVVGMVLRRGLAVAAAGLAVGGFLTIASSRLLQNWLYDASILNTIPLLVSAGILFCIVLAACFLPSRRAAAIDPALSLRVG